MDKRIIAQVAAFVVVVGVVSFGGGYVIAGGPERMAEQHTVGENIVVSVKAPGQDTYTQLDMKSGMTVLDAVTWVVPIKTDLTWVSEYGPAIKTVDDKWLVCTVNGESLDAGMVERQLSGGENIELALA